MADSIREALSAAIAAAPPEDTDTTPISPDPVPAQEVEDVSTAPAEVDKAASPAEPSGNAGLEKTPAVVPASPDQPPKAGSPPQPTAAKATPSAAPPADPPPASWKADEKAAWAALPGAAKAAIRRREADTQRALSVSASARKMEDGFQKTIAPYQSLFQKHNVTPDKVMSEVVAPILEIRRILETGSPQDKAFAAYNIIKGFGVDVNTLDTMLLNGPPATLNQPPPPKVDYSQIPELAPLFSVAKQLEAQEEARLDAMIAEVQNEPHFEELREDTAAVLQSFAAKGIEISLRSAFNRAKLLRPDISPIEAPVAPPAATTVSEAAAILAKSRKAASTVSGAPKSTPGTKSNNSLRASLESAFEAAG